MTYEDRPAPKLEDAHDVIIHVNYTGICGSEIHYWQHGRIGPYVLESPMVLGHESAGTVVEVGSAVKSLSKGDRVAMEPGISCRRCVRCLEGKYNLCTDMAFAATPPYDGTLTKFYRLPEELCYKLPDHVTLEEGALIEPLAVAVHITRQSNIVYGSTVVVYGSGPVGLLCCAVAKAYGAKKIIAVDIQQQRLDFARSFAADSVFMPEKVSAEENAARLIRENELGEGADVAIDASGAEPSIQAAMHVLRKGGSYVQGGMGREEITFPITVACTKELQIRGSFRYGSGDYTTAVDMVSSGRVDVKRLISRKVPFEDAAQALEDVSAGKGIKVLIEGPP